MDNVVEINVDLLDKYDLVEKYNKSVVSRNLIDYIIEQAMEYKPSSNFKIIVSKKGQIDHDSTKLIRDGLTKEFEKALKKLSRKEQKAVMVKLKLLVQEPFYPSLRTKKVQGLDNIFEMSVNMDIRILWKYENGVIILLLDVGHHKDMLGI